MENESLSAAQAKLTSYVAQRIGIFFHGIADENQRPYPLPLRLIQRMIQHGLNLSLATQAGNAGKPPRQIRRILQKRCRSEFAKASVIGKRNGKPTNALRRLQHLRRQPRRLIPGALARCRGINREDQPRHRRGRRPQRRHTRRLIQKGGHGGRRGARGGRFAQEGDVGAGRAS